MTSNCVVFPVFNVVGSNPHFIGLSYGSQLSARIKRCYDLYYSWFVSLGSNEKYMKDFLVSYKKVIEKECPEIMQEMQGMSEGANIELWKILLINCRTEILNEILSEIQSKSKKEENNECSGIICCQRNILAQNWDWRSEMEDLVVLLRIHSTQKQSTILMMIEPGMVGKIGLNSNGIGCSLMLLSNPNPLKTENSSIVNNAGIPIHILMRLILECSSFAEINDLLENRLTINTFSCLGICNAENEGYFLEFCGFRKWEKLIAFPNGLSFHTNHYHGCGFHDISQQMASRNSWSREKQMIELHDGVHEGNENGIKCILTNISEDSERKRDPICRHFVFRKSMKLKIGTVCTILMDMKRREMSVARAPAGRTPIFHTYAVNTDSSSSKL